MAHFNLTDFEWSIIQPLLPNKLRGMTRVMIVAYLTASFDACGQGALWEDIPDRYGPIQHA